ncbi:MAG: hypothetical protein ABSE76_03570 [Minisyncoccia bacterium]|jgi:hypothetical protein
MKKIVAQSVSLAFVLFAVPLVAFAQALQPIRNLIVAIGGILNITIPVLIAAAIVVFFWGLVMYIRKPEIAEGKNVMIAGLISLFIMVSVWGLVNLAQNSLGVSGSASVQIPQVPTAQY